MRRCSTDWGLGLEEGEAESDSMHIERLRIWVQRFAEEGVLPKPCMGWR